MLLFQRRHVGRTHRAVELLAALADAGAALHRPGEATLRLEAEVRLELDGPIAGRIAQVFGHRRRIDDLAGVHDVEWIEGALDVLEGAVELRAE